MAYTFGDQKNLLSVLLGDSNTGSDDAFPETIREKFINDGELQFAKDSLCLMEYATGTVSSSQIALPSDWLETFIIVVNDRVLDPSREISIQDYERYYNYTGNPPYYYYWRFSGTRYIKFFGSPNDQTYKLYYFRRPTTALADDTDTSIHDEEYRQASVYWAAASLLQQSGKNTQADRYLQIYQKFVRDAEMQNEKHIVKKMYPNVDVNIVGSSETDITGGGW